MTDTVKQNALWALSQILDDLPENRDWLDPNLEAFARNLVKENAPDMTTCRHTFVKNGFCMGCSKAMS